MKHIAMFVCLAESRVPEEVLPRMVGSMRRKYKKEPTPSFDAVSRLRQRATGEPIETHFTKMCGLG